MLLRVLGFELGSVLGPNTTLHSADSNHTTLLYIEITVSNIVVYIAYIDRRGNPDCACIL